MSRRRNKGCLVASYHLIMNPRLFYAFLITFVLTNMPNILHNLIKGPTISETILKSDIKGGAKKT
jgi:hypothetical protein